MNAYIWQMNDGTWRISATSGRPAAEILADEQQLTDARLDRAYADRHHAECALYDHRRRQRTKVRSCGFPGQDF